VRSGLLHRGYPVCTCPSGFPLSGHIINVEIDSYKLTVQAYGVRLFCRYQQAGWLIVTVARGCSAVAFSFRR